MRRCKKCGKLRELSEYSWSDKKRGYKKSKCKECEREYNKNWKKENPDYFKKYNKKYSWKRKKFKNNFIKYDSNIKNRKLIELYEQIRESKNGNLECKCTYCGDWFEPTYTQIQNRIKAIYGIKHRISPECRLYCSVNCKKQCPIYKQILYPKDFKPATSREVQPQLRQLVFERDNHTCQKCSKYKDELEVGLHCHHIWPLNEDPIGSADVDSCITLCAECHKWIHQNVAGCGYSELNCI